MFKSLIVEIVELTKEVEWTPVIGVAVIGLIVLTVYRQWAKLYDSLGLDEKLLPDPARAAPKTHQACKVGHKPSCVLNRCYATSQQATIFIEGFKTFQDFKDWLLSQYPQTPEQLSVDRENAVMFFPWEGGLIILKSDGTWDFDVAPFSD